MKPQSEAAVFASRHMLLFDTQMEESVSAEHYTHLYSMHRLYSVAMHKLYTYSAPIVLPCIINIGLWHIMHVR